MIDRRRFLAGATAAALAGAVRAQPKRPLRVGILRPSEPLESSGPSPFARGMETALEAAASAAGRALAIESRYAGRDVKRLPVLARELVALPCDVIVTVGSSASLAARDASRTVPIVLFGNLDPVALGLVPSLSRPGGNLTGVLIAAGGTLAAKRLELLREAVPGATRIAMLAPDDPGFRPQITEAEKAAAAMGIPLPVVTVRAGYDAAFAAVDTARAQALFVGATTYFVRDRRAIIAQALAHRLPTSFEWPEQAEEGGFMAYGTSVVHLYRRVADYVLRIAGGADPGTLPIEQPTSYELVFNAGTARALGIAVPPPLLLRADRVFA